MDAATRFLGGRVLLRESPEEFVLALERGWIRTFGPMKIFCRWMIIEVGHLNMSSPGAQRMGFNCRSLLDRATHAWPFWNAAIKSQGEQSSCMWPIKNKEMRYSLMSPENG